MKNTDITRAWKDELYRYSLDQAQAEALPANPAGSIELHRDLLDQASGGAEAVTVALPTACGPSIQEICPEQAATL